jgi:membrane protein DedA with SNARE-associated domain
MTHADQFALTYGAALLFTWIPFQQAGAPIPGAPLLIAVGLPASYGHLRPVPCVLAASTACLLAEKFWCRTGLRGWSKNHRLCRTNSKWKERVLTLLSRHSGASMLLAKITAGSNVVPLLAGQARKASGECSMHLPRMFYADKLRS